MTIYLPETRKRMPDLVVAPEVRLDRNVLERRLRAERLVRDVLNSNGYNVDSSFGNRDYDCRVGKYFVKFKSSPKGVFDWLENNSRGYCDQEKNEGRRQILTIVRMAKEKRPVLNCQFWNNKETADTKIVEQMKLWERLSNGECVAKELKDMILENAKLVEMRSKG